MQISVRAREEKHSPIRALVDLALERKKEGIHPHFLNIGQPDIPAPKEFFDFIQSSKNETIAYSHAKGDLNLREAWANYYNRRGVEGLTSNEVLITYGASEALVLALMGTCDQGDEVLSFDPLYPNYKSFCRMVGVRLKTVVRSIDDGFHLPSFKDLERAITPKTKAILFSNPCNPTGVVFKKEEIESLIDFCAAKGLFIISDEVYHEITFSEKATSVLEFPKARECAIAVDSVSKKFSLCGARVGTLMTYNQNLLDAVANYASARLSAPTLDQKALVPVLENAENIIASVKNEFEARKNVVFQELNQIQGVQFKEPQGALYAFLSLPVPSAKDFCRWLVSDFSYEGETVVLAPGDGFYNCEGEGLNQIRIANVLEVETLKKAMQVIKNGLESYCI